MSGERSCFPVANRYSPPARGAAWFGLKGHDGLQHGSEKRPLAFGTDHAQAQN
jgi:hypothetical protein